MYKNLEKNEKITFENAKQGSVTTTTLPFKPSIERPCIVCGEATGDINNPLC